MASEASGVGGSILGAFGAIQQGQAQSNALDRAAQIERQNASLDLAAGQLNAQIAGIQAAHKMGAISTGYAASGVGGESESAMAVLGASASAAELDKQNIIHGSQVRAINYENQASMDEAGAKSALQGSYLNAISSIFMGGSKVFGQSAGVAPGSYTPTTGNSGASGDGVEGGAVGDSSIEGESAGGDELTAMIG